MKATKKIVGATCALVAAVALSAGSTFAWFSANTNVTATGLNVTAKSDSVFLTINAGSVFNTTSVANSATSTDVAGKSLYPVAHGTATSGTGTPSAITTTDADHLTGATWYSNWYYAYSSAADNAGPASGTAVQLSSTSNKADYLASDDFMVGLNASSGATKAYNLTVTSVTLPANTGIVLVIICDSKAYEFKEGFVASETGKQKEILAEVTKTGHQITAYYYIDGNNTNVTTTNIATLTGAVTFTLGVSVSDT